MHITVNELSKFIFEIDKQATSYFLKRVKKQEMLLQCTLTPPNKAVYQISSRPGIAKDLLQQFYKILQKIKAPKVTGSISFQCTFKMP